MSDFNLIVIGAGPGGYTAALTAAKLGLKTAVVESREIGGTCLNRGCIPTKALLHASETYRQILSSERMGIAIKSAEIELPRLNLFRQSTIEKLRGGVESLLQNANVTILRGKATIADNNEIHVDSEVYTADKIIIATGSTPAKPPIPGLDLPGVVTSDELLEDLEKLPCSIVIIGGGVIGVEFATFFSDLDIPVTIVEGMDRLLPGMDKELGQNLALILKRKGVKVFTGAMVNEVERSEGGLSVRFTQKGTEQMENGKLILCAIGRRPYTEGLFSANARPEMEGGRIVVDDGFRTSIKNIYAIGDVASKIQLAHVAAAQGTICAKAIAGSSSGMEISIVPSCVYCKPEIACVGMTEAEARQNGLEVTCSKSTLFSNARNIIADGDRSFIKLVADGKSGRLLGAQLMCEHATDMVSQLSQAIANGLGAEDLLKAMRPHPTYEEALSDSLQELINKRAK